MRFLGEQSLEGRGWDAPILMDSKLQNLIIQILTQPKLTTASMITRFANKKNKQQAPPQNKPKNQPPQKPLIKNNTQKPVQTKPQIQPSKQLPSKNIEDLKTKDQFQQTTLQKIDSDSRLLYPPSWSQSESDEVLVLELAKLPDQHDCYVGRIGEYLMGLEKKVEINPFYCHKNRSMSVKMRYFLVRYLYKICQHHLLQKSTIFQAVSIMDTYFSKAPVFNLLESQQIVVSQACMFIAMKNNEIYPPSLREFVEKSQIKSIIEMQGNILKKLNFNLTMPNSLYFTKLFLLQNKRNEQNIGYQKKLQTINYILDLSLFDPIINKNSPSEIARHIIGLVFEQKIGLNEKTMLDVKWMIERNCRAAKWMIQKGYYSKNICLH